MARRTARRVAPRDNILRHCSGTLRDVTFQELKFMDACLARQAKVGNLRAKSGCDTKREAPVLSQLFQIKSVT